MVFIVTNGEAFRVFRIGMSVVGNWPPDRNKRGSMIIFTVTLLIQITLVASRLINPYGKCSSFEAGSREFRQTSLFIMALVQQTIVRAYGGRMIPLIESAIEDWSSILDPEHRRIMKDQEKSMIKLCILQIVFMNVLPVIFSTLPLMTPNGAKLQNDRQICAFDDDFAWIWLVRVITVIVDVVSHGCLFLDGVIVWTLAAHISGQNKILAKRFRKFLSMRSKIARGREFRRLVERHNRLLGLTGALEDSFNLLLGVQIVFCQYFVCLGAFRLIGAMKTVNFVEAAIALAYMIVIFGSPFLYCYAGDSLIESCEDIGRVLLHCDWHDITKVWIVNHGIVIARCRRPKILTAAKMCELNLSNLKIMLKTVYSFISLIIAMN